MAGEKWELNWKLLEDPKRGLPIGPRTLFYYQQALKRRLAIAPKVTVYFWAVKVIIRNGTH